MTDEFSLRGRLEEILFPELLLKISERMETGVLRVSRSKIEKHVYFQEGKIVFAKSNDPDDRLGDLLLRRNRVTYRQLVDSATKVVPGKRLGTVLVLEGHITPNDLYHGVIDQIKEIIYSIFDWSEGQYEFFPGNLPTEEVITLNLSTPDLILAGVARIWRWSWIRKGSISLDAVFRKRDGWFKIARKMEMTPELQTLTDLLDRPRTLEEITRNSQVGDFETCRLMWGLLTVGIAEQMLAAPPWAAVSQTIEAPTVEIKTEELLSSMEESVNSEQPEAALQPQAIISPEPEIVNQEVEPELHPEVEEVVIHVEPPLEPEQIQAPSVIQEEQSVQEEATAEEQPVLEKEATAEEQPVLEDKTVVMPSADLSFSDLAELTDDNLETAVVAHEISEEPWEKNVPADVKNFNEQHRYLFEMLRLELGAGVNNFLSKTFKQVSTKFPMVFDGVRMNDFGEFEENSLISNVEGNLIENYNDAFRYLFQEELNTIHSYLEKKRADMIETGLLRIADKQRVVH